MVGALRRLTRRANHRDSINMAGIADGGRLTWPIGAVIFVVLFGLYGSDFFYFLLPNVMLWLVLVGGACAVPLAILTFLALLRFRWRLIPIFVIVWALLSLRFFGVWAPTEWLNVQGFRVGNLLTQGYPAGCSHLEFIENGIKQTLGLCRGFDRGDHFDFIVYDKTGEFVLPASRRSPEWKQAMSEATNTHEELESRENPAYRLYGDFYVVFVSFYDMRGG
jgi:hypothetical protein